MSKAQDLLSNRKKIGSEVTFRSFDRITGSDSLESYYNNILSDADIEKALAEYQGHYEELTNEFIEKTRLQREDIGFLFIAVAMQCARIYLINKLTGIEKANVSGGKEDAIHGFQEKVLGKLYSGDMEGSRPLYAPLNDIISTRGVPYDAQTPFSEEIKMLHLFKGSNHRFSTLGHDPLIGLLFGTANILTNTISINHKFIINTYSVIYEDLKNPKIGMPVSTVAMLKLAISRFENDKKSVAAAVIKQLLHIATDMYTPCGIQLPGAGLVLSNTNVELLTKYISTGDVVKVSASSGMAMLINTLISAIHGCCLLCEYGSEEIKLDLYQARTRKIIMYSNIIVSSSNVLSAALGDIKTLDIGGLLVTISRIFSDTALIKKLEYEFINNSLSDIYSEKVSSLEKLYV